jgi:hypothetical protein
MAKKYKHYDKYMLSFTVPTTVKGKTIKNGRYTKLRYLIKIRAYIAKLLNNTDDVKYFMNIELGKKFSNPHIHLQLWMKPNDNSLRPAFVSLANDTSATSAEQIFTKTISKFNLNKNRCHLTLPEKDIDIYHYVIKDYAKDLSDKDIWDLETQKKRMRSVLGSRVRFYSKSKDKYSKKIYRIMYYSWGVVRDKVNKYLDFFINNFFYFNKRNFKKIVVYFSLASKLGYIEQGRFILYEVLLVFDVLFVSPARSPPSFVLVSYVQVKNI